MNPEPDYDMGLLGQSDLEELDRILDDWSDGCFGAPALHGFLVASVIGPEPIPKECILPAVLIRQESRQVDFRSFPGFAWVEEKINDWLGRIERVFREQPRAFTLLVYQPKLNEGDATPDPQSWCRGFIEATEYHEDEWRPFFESKNSFGMFAPILLKADGGEWRVEDIPNPFMDLNLSPDQMCEILQVSVVGIESFWKRYHLESLNSET